MPTLATNKHAKFDYEILEEFEGGLKLTGAEVKSAKLGHISMQGSFMTMQDGELYLKNMHVSPYAPAGTKEAYDPTRDRKVLIHKAQVKKLIGKHQAEGLTIVPISVYTKGALVKVGFALARGKKKYEKRETIKKRDLDREAREEMKKTRFKD